MIAIPTDFFTNLTSEAIIDSKTLYLQTIIQLVKCHFVDITKSITTLRSQKPQNPAPAHNDSSIEIIPSGQLNNKTKPKSGKTPTPASGWKSNKWTIFDHGQ